ncbi:hypothetical protein BgiBS90_034478, partial [Biomphalaria glabrata]
IHDRVIVHRWTYRKTDATDQLDTSNVSHFKDETPREPSVHRLDLQVVINDRISGDQIKKKANRVDNADLQPLNLSAKVLNTSELLDKLRQ